MTSEPAVDRPTLTSVTLASLPYVTLLGCAAIMANIVLSFEEPHADMLLISAVLLAAAPIGMALHLAFTHELTPEEKRKWISGLMSRKGPELFGAYFTSAARRRATELLPPQAAGAESGQP
jgi:hypothetical protein